MSYPNSSLLNVLDAKMYPLVVIVLTTLYEYIHSNVFRDWIIELDESDHVDVDFITEIQRQFYSNMEKCVVNGYVSSVFDKKDLISELEKEIDIRVALGTERMSCKYDPIYTELLMVELVRRRTKTPSRICMVDFRKRLVGQIKHVDVNISKVEICDEFLPYNYKRNIFECEW